MSQKFVSALAFSSICLAAACGLPYEQDEPAVAERYSFRFRGECSSWLVSPRTGFKYCASPAIDLPSNADAIPGFEGMEQFTKKNIAEEIVQFIKMKIGAFDE